MTKSDPSSAVEPLGRAVKICEKQICQARLHGYAIFSLAKVFVATHRNKNRAINLAWQARDIYNKTPTAFRNEIMEVEEWLQTHDSGKRKSISTARR